MHCLYFVKIDDKEIKTSQQAREHATNILDANNFASDSNGFYGNSKADWYVVGGRWSGLLSKKQDEERDGYQELGYDDDAVQITPELLAQLKAEDYGDVEVAVIEEGGIEHESTINQLILDGDDYSNQWLVTIDYHE